MTPPVREVVGAVYDRAFSCRTEDVGFFDHVIRSEESYEQKWVYVRDNPVRAGLVRSAEDWPVLMKLPGFPIEKEEKARS